MSVTSMFYKLPKEEFDKYLSSLKQYAETIHFQNGKYFYCPTSELSFLMLQINRAQWELNSLFYSFSELGQRQIIQSLFIDEIEATNKIENINSTRHDIYCLMNSLKDIKDMKIVSILNSYKLLFSDASSISSLEEVRKIYDSLFCGAIDENDYPDGVLFRKEAVEVTDGVNTVHQGINTEERITLYMNEWLSLFNSKRETYEKMILAHFLLENIHPFYDGNGRLGRFLFSKGLKLFNGGITPFLISKAFSSNKKKYYKSFSIADDFHEFGCLNETVSIMGNILLESFEREIEILRLKKETIKNIAYIESLSFKEEKVYSLLKEATILTEFGISNEEIMKEAGVSKRTLMYSLNKLEKLGLLETKKIGRMSFHRIK